MILRRFAPCASDGRPAADFLSLAWRLAFLAGCGFLTYLWLTKEYRASVPPHSSVRTFAVLGVVEEVIPGQSALVVSHEAIGSFMRAMTMPFNVRPAQEMLGMQPGDAISFRLSMTETESWIDRIMKLGFGSVARASSKIVSESAPVPSQNPHPLRDYSFTNQLGQPVTLHSFEGQALAITFFFTRCPIPDFCPRLSKNFAEASSRLTQLAHGPTNWHFLSVSFDPEFDSPTVLKAYGEKYRYDPSHWSFITGPKDKILELARLSNVEVEPDSGLFNHNFRTMIIDASGKVQMIFPMGGDLSDAIVSEMLKATVRTARKPL